MIVMTGASVLGICLATLALLGLGFWIFKPLYLFRIKKPGQTALDLEIQGYEAALLERQRLIQNLRELEEEKSLGKMEDKDFAELKQKTVAELHGSYSRIETFEKQNPFLVELEKEIKLRTEGKVVKDVIEESMAPINLPLALLLAAALSIPSLTFAAVSTPVTPMDQTKGKTFCLLEARVFQNANNNDAVEARAFCDGGAPISFEIKKTERPEEIQNEIPRLISAYAKNFVENGFRTAGCEPSGPSSGARYYARMTCTFVKNEINSK